MESKKINQLATNVNPQTSDLTTIGDPITGQLKKITWLQVAHLIGAQASVTLQQVTDNGNTTTDPITTGGLTLTNIGTGVVRSTNGEVVGTYGYGLANGVATLDSGGKIPAAQLPSSVMEYKGTWNASTNTPTLADGTGDNGDVYLVNVAGSQDLGSGTISFAVGDWVVYNGTIWQKSLNSNAVASVFGRTGTITAQEGDYNIDQLGDVAITSAAANDYLRYTGSSWVNTPFPSLLSSDKLLLAVRNNSGATINKGTVVYINGATAGYPTIAKALATGDATSAQTMGVVQDNISNNANGYVVAFGQITGIDTSAYTAGTQLYLSSTTAGAFTSTKQYAPNHLVYVGVVTTQNAVNGVIEVRVQNGYELDEIHDVSAQNPSNNDGIFYNTTTSLWESKSIATVLGFTPFANPMTTLGDIIYGGASGAATRLAGNTTTTKQYLSQTGNGTVSAAPAWATIAGSDITGAALTKTDDTNVTLTLGGTPATALLRAASLTLGWTGQLAISRGGTGASTAIAAFDALSPLTTLGDFIYHNGTDNVRLAGNITATRKFIIQTGTGTISAAPVWDTILAADIPASALTKTDDTNVTLTLGGTPASSLLAAVSLTLGWTGQLSIARGGTGASTKAAAFDALSPMTTLGDIVYGGASGTGTRLAGNTTTTKQYLSQTGTGTVSAAPSWATISGTDITGAALTETDDTNVTLTLGGTPSTALLRAVSLTLGWTGQLSVARGGTGAASFTAGEILYGAGTSAIATSSTFTFSPTGKFLVNNSAAAGGIGIDFTPTVNANANNDIIYGLRVNPTFNNGAYTGVTQRALGVFGNVYINGTITGAAWGGSVIGSSYGGAGTVSGILKANGSGTVSAAVAGTDYVVPSALNSYLPLTGGTLTNTGGNTTAILNFTGSSTDSFQWMTWAANSSLAAGNTILHVIGKAKSTKNSAGFGFQWNSDSGNDNFLTLGMFNADHLLKIFGNGNATLSGAFTSSISALGSAASTFVVSDSGTLKSRTAAQVLSDIGAAASSSLSNYLLLTGGTLTGALGGTTASFSTSSNTLLAGVSTRNTSAGAAANVGFVLGNNTTTNGGGIALFSSGYTSTGQYRAAGTYVYSNQGGGLTLNAEGANSMYLATNGTTALTINSSQAATFSSVFAGYGMSITNVQDSSQGLLLRASDNDTTLYLARFQSSVGATSTTWVDRFSIAKNGSTVIGDNAPFVNVRLTVKGEDQTASNYALDIVDSLNQSIAWFRNDKSIRLNGATTLTYTYNGGGTGMLHLTSGGTEGGSITFEKTSGTAQKYKVGNSGTEFFIYNETAGNKPFAIANSGATTFRVPDSATAMTIRHLDGTNNPGLFISVVDSTRHVRLTASGSAVTGQLLQFGAEGNVGILSVGGSTVTAANTLLANSPSEGNTGEGLIAGRSFKIDATGTGQSAKMYVVTKTLSDTYGSAFQIQFANSDDNKGFGYNINTSGGYETYVKDSSANWQKAVTITQDRYFRLATKGIQFNGDTAEANSLDDYEEGTWTPVLRGSSTAGTFTYNFRSGSYTKIGNTVFVRWGFKLLTASGAAGTVQISGLPFTSANYGGYQEPGTSVSTGALATAANASRARMFVMNSSTVLEGRVMDNGDTAWSIGDFGGDEWIIGEVFYNIS